MLSAIADRNAFFTQGWEFPFDGANPEKLGEAAGQRCDDRSNSTSIGTRIQDCRYEYAGMWLSEAVVQAEGAPRRTILTELEVSDPKWTVKYGLNVGAASAHIREVLGAPQQIDVSTWRYEDAVGNAVIFTIAVDRIVKVPWVWATHIEAVPAA